MRGPKRPGKGLELRQVLQVVPFGAVTVGSQVFVVNEVHRSTHAILAVFSLDTGLKRRLAEANQVGNKGARNIPVVADSLPFFLLNPNQFDMGAWFVVTNSDDAKISHGSGLRVMAKCHGKLHRRGSCVSMEVQRNIENNETWHKSMETYGGQLGSADHLATFLHVVWPSLEILLDLVCPKNVIIGSAPGGCQRQRAGGGMNKFCGGEGQRPSNGFQRQIVGKI